MTEIAKLKERIKKLESEKESWKNEAISVSSENCILYKELSIAIKQGYKPTKAFQKLSEK